ncbi:MAG: Gmad2 immunoglobulin-like domain-containing protein [Acidimicrobiia bacterium]
MSEYDERKMKDLIDRLVAMSPEPPPFPEEVNVTQRNITRSNPILMFAGAAAVVLVLAAIPFLIFGGRNGGGIADTTTSTIGTTVTSDAPATTTTEPTTTTTTAETVDREGVYVFLAQTPENSNTGNPALVPFYAVADSVFDSSDANALNLLTQPNLTLPPGFENYVPSDVHVVGVSDGGNGVRVVDMSPEFAQGSGSGLLGDFTMLNQLIYTAGLDSEATTQVQFTVGGQPVTQFGTDGLDISGPLDRESFIDNLNSVIPTSAAAGSGSDPLLLLGKANVFEATVSLELVDLDGNVVYQDFTTASCGTGCWGDFSFDIDYDFSTGPVSIRLFWNSAKDGSPTDVVTMPVSWGDETDSGAWNFLPTS